MQLLVKGWIRNKKKGLHSVSAVVKDHCVIPPPPPSKNCSFCHTLPWNTLLILFVYTKHEKESSLRSAFLNRAFSIFYLLFDGTIRLFYINTYIKTFLFGKMLLLYHWLNNCSNIKFGYLVQCHAKIVFFSQSFYQLTNLLKTDVPII